MFTGIITDIGEVIEREDAGDTRLRIASHYDPDTVAIGASIAHDGCCLTVVDKGRQKGGRMWHDVTASAETLSKTTLGGWRPGRRVNLERALKMGDELGGHMVTGHVDSVCEIVSITPDGDSQIFRFRAPAELAPFIAAKGSVALNGTSLTVNAVEDREFTVNIIPHTLHVTTWGDAKAGDAVNLEIDPLARYVARLLDR
ncbi:MAG TPA: riboflavin synthase [Thermopetrobacter sp.]|nr:riboflavin synthase [Thermopetrobacter sp.]